uniref:Tripartite motif-containing protein 16-like n=2 Tax=Oncorhynchus kisutch TaxID=8019 RepID=A0A8C7KXI8_ONCKI
MSSNCFRGFYVYKYILFSNFTHDLPQALNKACVSMYCGKMAEAMDSISCSICLDTQKDPVTIPCGHSYCMGCMKGYWDQDNQKDVYSCPLCKESFFPRPVLRKNTLLAELVEKLKERLEVASPVHYYAGSGDVECDFCTGRKLKAVMSCLGCLASYCETHLQPHHESPAFKKHKLIKASTQLQEKICSRHDKLLEVYCRTDQQFICYQCLLDEHKGHNTVSLAAERTEKQRQLENKRQKSQQRIQKREKEMQEVRQSMKSLKFSVQAAIEDTERIFTELMRSIERSCSKVKELIRAQEKMQVILAEELLEQLKQEVAELRRRDAELEQLSNTEDHIHFLQSFKSLSDPPGSEIITVNQSISFEGVKTLLSGLKKQLEDVFKKEMTKVPGLDQLTLDPNTVHNRLCLSEGNRKVTWSSSFQSYPDHPDRFTSNPQVLCSKGLSGACYWEVEWRGFGVYIAVSYKGISKKCREECLFGQNDQSWCLICSHSGCSFYHNDKKTAIRVPYSSRVGVYLDHKAGTLSFYNVSDTMILLHRVQTKFTQPLYPGLGFQHGIHFGFGPSVKILSLTQKGTLV